MPRTNRFNETFGPRDRAPLTIGALFAVTTIGAVTLTVISCSDRDEQPRVEPVAAAVAPGAIAEPVVTTPPEPAAPRLVSYEDAESSYRAHDYGRATEMFGAYVERRPDNPWGHYMLGLSAWKSGRLDVARGAFERAIELDPKHVKSHLNLTRVLLDDGQVDAALEHATAALALDSSLAEGHRVMARVRTAMREPETALEEYRIALSLDPEDVWSMNNMGLVLIREGRYEQALPPLARAVQLRPTAPVFQNNLGIALERTGRFVAAASAYEAALKADSSYGKASVSLARVRALTEDSTTVPVEITELAAEFDELVSEWREMRAPSTPTVPVQEITVAPDSVKVPEW